MITVQMLSDRLLEAKQRFPNAPIRVQAWSDQGDLVDIELRGDIRLDRDAYGNPVVTLR
jgi:hypothetical protein